MSVPRPHILSLTSGKGGVGRSSLALNLAVALGERDQRVLLVDADPHPGHLALLVGAEAPSALVTDAGMPGRPLPQLARGVDLLQLLPSSGPARPDVTAAGALSMDAGPEEGRMPDGSDLEALEANYQWLIVDTGPGIDPASMAAARYADTAWIVLTPDLTAVADGYATAKRLLGQEPRHRLGCLVNAVDGEQEATDVQEGFADLVERFLGAQIDNRGYIPLDRTVRDAAKSQYPFCLASPSTPAAVAVADVASELIERHPIVTLHRHRAYLEVVARLMSAPQGEPSATSMVQEPSLTA